ncbi:hypothetical protein E6P09_09480 [Haloferax mediterranei ATCC 33500]|uniref:Uncharacterized protein n=1 Tax=Haloferax mediterranei (strain ATCC 33500 / DSM 1411 / JCM 8866 / NBRC 14739 / NCIMB 2177 / R-4) TaxID=523841 RepID=I3R447_HALMT|nr:hypothetical protein [Haloferax mediterranei]AFK19007.1 hypothetical protein HFX_1295 [Haloferax mediterranei ATCC 33500]AHZ21637.1 hypothetical protein BM92_02725 [Haloferax mediterranei ATCC 33500]EMA03553.1 hypothetical protein C439_04040 [Haloferax mediterranei ATCC 33500]MDX5989099.1 hypothetical protein [Haloferax mediterranei ATCC 33500]QCQ75485.1 hypothetical protein E6P09_09480 [Haloferax mediterranei ATCC 33500]
MAEDNELPVWHVVDLEVDDSLSCSEKLTEVQSIVDSLSYQSLSHVSIIMEDCAATEPELCLETAFLIATKIRAYSGDLRNGLEAVGDADIDTVNKFVINTLDNNPIKDVHPLNSLIPHLYRGNEDDLVEQFETWRIKHEWFWYRAVDQTLVHYVRDAAKPSEEFSGGIRTIRSELKKIADAEGLDPEDNTGGNTLLEKTHDLLDDIYWAEVDEARIKQNIASYPNLEEFLRERDSWLDELTEHNEHALAKYLSHPYSESEADRILQDNDAEVKEQQKAERSLRKIRILDYYDRLIDVIDVGNEPTGELRDRLLDRPQFEKAIAELEVVDALRREFHTVEVEPTIPGTAGDSQVDCKITSTADPIWVEITHPDPTESAAVGDFWTATADPEKSYVRTIVTRKADQIIEAKEAGGLTMLVMKNEASRFEHVEVESYAAGPEMAVLPEDANEPVIVRGESGPELNDDDVTDHLDILVNFETHDVDDASLDGQVYVLNGEDVDQQVARKLASAFSVESPN